MLMPASFARTRTPSNSWRLAHRFGARLRWAFVTKLWRQHHGAGDRLLPVIALPNVPRLYPLDRQGVPDMTMNPRHALPKTRTMCAAFLVFAATATIPRVAAAVSVPICHVPPGNAANAHVVTVGEAAIPAHLMHDDFTGSDCVCSATEGAVCGASQAPCCAGLKCVADLTGVFTCQTGTSSNPLPPGNACTSSAQCDALNPCTSIGTNDSVCGG